MSTADTHPVRLAVFASGRGSNFRALAERIAAERDSPCEIALCVSNNPAPGAFDVARAYAIPSVRLSPRMFPDDESAYESRLNALLEEHGIDMIVLSGYMRKLPPGTVDRFRGRIVNVHPALLPKFGGKGMYGLNVHRAVIDAHERESGVTVHYVDEGYDTGQTIAQEKVPVTETDTPESLADRIRVVEHRLYPDVILQLARRIRKSL